MAMRVLHNRKNNSVTLHFAATTGTQHNDIIIAGGFGVSDIALTGETIDAAHIKKVWCGSASGASTTAYWTVKRGASEAAANTVLMLDSTAQIDYAGWGNTITLDEDQPMHVELVGTDSGYLMIELQKVAANTSGPMFNGETDYNRGLASSSG